MEAPLLQVKDLYVTYKSDGRIIKAVNGISFSIKKGETLGIVGETGAGKSTTALSVIKLLPKRNGKVESGSIIFNGTEITAATEPQMHSIRGELISMIFQDPMTSLNPVLSVGDQIGEAIKLHMKLDAAGVQKRVDEILELVGIPAARKNEYPHQFSGGMKQRVVIAIALACDPMLLLADEPTTALDVTIQAQILDMMDELKQKLGTAIILITHDLGVVAEICDNVAIMYAGEIIEIGTAKDIYNSTEHHPYTTGLFGSIPNLTVESDRLNPVDGLMPDPAELPEGCKFHPRCTHCMDVCKTTLPGDYVDGSHIIKCHLFGRTGAENNG